MCKNISVSNKVLQTYYLLYNKHVLVGKVQNVLCPTITVNESEKFF